MKILWVNSSTTATMSNTRLYALPPIFEKWGHPTYALLGGPKNEKSPDYFITLPVPMGKLGAYRLLVKHLLPFICLRLRPDVVISDWMSGMLFQEVIAFRKMGLLKCKLVHDVRTVPVKDDAGKSWHVYAESLKYARKHFDGVTTITELLREEICQQFDYVEDQIAVWTSGVDVDHFKPQDGSEMRKKLGIEDKFVVFYHGAINENRGVVEFAQAAEHLKDLPDVRLVIVGKGNEWNRLEAIVKQKNLTQVILQNGVPYADMPKWIAMGDLCAVPLPDHPWWRVSSPLKLMEYQAMGKAILLTEMKAHRAVISNDSAAFYIPDTEPASFAEGIRRALAKRDSLAVLGEKGRENAVSTLTWEIG
ncbi:glycosyltransferase family 4 protein, partial [bacterium]|nr:glycosyltransferase family 4 protein [bacterium]